MMLCNYMLNRIYSSFMELAKTKSLKNGSIWTLAGFGGEILLRMFSSLILTRIFLPEVFGLMAIIFALNAGMEMLSSVGIRFSVIHRPHGTKQYFLETAWTIQILRGLLLWWVLYIFTPQLALIFDEPALVFLLPVSALVLVLHGFNSIGIFTYARELGVAKVIVYKLITQIIALIFVISLSLIYKSIWVIIAGALLSSTLNLIISHTLYTVNIRRLQLDKTAVKDILSSGKWILFATIFHFLIGQGDRLLIGLFVSKTDLGLYNLAAMFTQIPLAIISALTANILMPFLTKRDSEDNALFNIEFERILKRIVYFAVPMAFTLTIFGPYLISWLYPNDFTFSGTILKYSALGTMFQIAAFSLIPLFLAKGDSLRHMLSYFSLFVFVFFAIYLGSYSDNFIDMIYLLVLAKILWLPVIIFMSRKYIQLSFNWLMLFLLFLSAIAIPILVYD
jgi:O-antigen/teichoic acid export membrane protein